MKKRNAGPPWRPPWPAAPDAPEPAAALLASLRSAGKCAVRTRSLRRSVGLPLPRRLTDRSAGHVVGRMRESRLGKCTLWAVDEILCLPLPHTDAKSSEM